MVLTSQTASFPVTSAEGRPNAAPSEIIARGIESPTSLTVMAFGRWSSPRGKCAAMLAKSMLEQLRVPRLSAQFPFLTPLLYRPQWHPASSFLATAVPPHTSRMQAKAIGRRAFRGKAALFDRLSGVFDNAGIARRHLVAPLDWYEQSHGWAERNALYLEASETLFEQAAAEAIAKAGLTPADIDGVVTVSTP